MRVVPLTVLPGHEQWPTFSPDGDQVAFEWDGENGDNADIYIKMVGSSEVRRLTSDPASDQAPSWSPDGRQIAYVRDQSGIGGRPYSSRVAAGRIGSEAERRSGVGAARVVP